MLKLPHTVIPKVTLEEVMTEKSWIENPFPFDKRTGWTDALHQGKRRVRAQQTKLLIVLFSQHFWVCKHFSAPFTGFSHFSELYHTTLYHSHFNVNQILSSLKVNKNVYWLKYSLYKHAQLQGFCCKRVTK